MGMTIQGLDLNNILKDQAEKELLKQMEKDRKREQNFFERLVDGKDLRNGLQLAIGLTYQ